MLKYLTRGARLRAGPVRHGQFSRTKELGEPIDLIWPCTNSGDGDGSAFIRVTESGLAVWEGPPFGIPALQTVPINLHQTIDLSLGLHGMIAEMHEGPPPAGVRLIASDTVALTVVSNPVLAAVGLPTIDGILAPTSIFSDRIRAIPVSWVCGNTGGGPGRARLRFVASPAAFMQGVVGTLVVIPGFFEVSLLLTLSPPILGGVGFTCVLTLEDDLAFPTILGTFQFTVLT